MLKPNVYIEEFEKYGFKKCKSPYDKSNCYYLCVANGAKMIFLSPVLYEISKWEDDDPRIHKRPNCRYLDARTALDITYDLIKADMIIRV